MKLYTLLFVIWLTCSGTDGLTCWLQAGSNQPAQKQDCSIGVNGGLGEMACSRADTGGNVVKTCAPKLYSGCKSSGGVSVCFCTSNLCNTGSNTRTANIFHFLMVSVAMVVSTRCLKSAFI